MSITEVERQQLLIGGEWSGAGSGETFDRLDPYTGEVASTAAAASREDARAAADAAAAAFGEWSATPPSARRELLQKAAALLLERAPEIAPIVTAETGGTFGWGMFNCHLAAGMLGEAAAMTTSVTGEVIPSDVPGLTAMAIRQPAGVVLGIAPWNAPVILGTRAVATPLAFGNTVVLKASEVCPRTHGEIARAIADAGVPAGVVNLLTHPADAAPDVVDELIAHPAVRRINFTGSTRVGRLVAENAARHLKRVLLELGGKAPLVVLADADLDEAVAAAKFGAFMHQGQICMSTEKIVADRSIAEDFASMLGEKAGALKVGDPRDPSTEIGPLVSSDSLERIGELVEDARSQGAEVVTGGEAEGPCYRPTVLAGVTPEMRIYHEESFGPVVGIVSVDGPDEAVRVANDTEYGLAASVFGDDVPTALELAHRIESGICHVNGATVHDEPQMPFGGVKASGFGRFGGKAAIDEFTELRWITVQQGSRHYPL
jgi:acyl-CoA reductase-like NAD-dependent aldehyde dehydrogenase